MRRHVAIALATYLAIAGVYLFFHRHIYVLGQVLYTYAVFGRQSLNYYDFPQPETTPYSEAPDFEKVDIVPRIIHQIFLQEQLPSDEDATLGIHHKGIRKHYYAVKACKDFHPAWEFRLWTSANATAFVGEHYPHLLTTYLSYPQTIQRANILRYLLLHHYGGVYLDLDLACRAPLDSFLHLPWLTPGAHPAGINNAFMLSEPRHPFLEDMLIPSIEERNLRWGMPYVTNMLSTGCMFISTLYVRADKSDLFILGGGTEHFLRGHAITPLFEHFGDSSWHRWDAALILWIGSNRILALVMAVGGVVGFVWGVSFLFRLGRRRRAVLSKSWKPMQV